MKVLPIVLSGILAWNVNAYSQTSSILHSESKPQRAQVVKSQLLEKSIAPIIESISIGPLRTWNLSEEIITYTDKSFLKLLSSYGHEDLAKDYLQFVGYARKIDSADSVQIDKFIEELRLFHLKIDSVRGKASDPSLLFLKYAALMDIRSESITEKNGIILEDMLNKVYAAGVRNSHVTTRVADFKFNSLYHARLTSVGEIFQLYDEAISQDSSNQVPCIHKGELYFVIGNYDAAISSYKEYEKRFGADDMLVDQYIKILDELYLNSDDSITHQKILQKKEELLLRSFNPEMPTGLEIFDFYYNNHMDDKGKRLYEQNKKILEKNPVAKMTVIPLWE